MKHFGAKFLAASIILCGAYALPSVSAEPSVTAYSTGLAPACWNPAPKVEAVSFNPSSFVPFCDYLVPTKKVKTFRVLPDGVLLAQE